MTFNPSEGYGDELLCLKIVGEFQGRALTAYCSPDSEGQTYFSDGEVVGNPIQEQYGAPFKVDIVLYEDVYPELESMQNIRDEVGSSFSAQFEEEVDEAFDEIADADDPIEAITTIAENN